jgi:tetratricopeptide (TPR) repeat protein
LLAYAWNDLLLLRLLKQPLLLTWALSVDSSQQTLFSVVYTIPMVFLMVIYFRYVFGYFMRNSERQADLYALELVGHPFTLASSLEKIAIASGHIHDVPSWHHFSIRQRIQFLLDSYRHPELRRRHHRKLYSMAVVFFVMVAGLATAGLQFKKSQVAKAWQGQVVSAVLERQVQEWSNNVELMGMAGSLLLEQGRYAEARDLMQKHLERSPDDPHTLNNLAWLYATAPAPYADPAAALELALKSVQEDPEPYALDTLAEAYFVNGRYREALETIQRAIDMKPDNLKYLLDQQKKFAKALREVSGAGASPP